MSESSPSPGSLSPDDALPPVEPPSAGFLVQLFVIPGVIVAIIVVVWLLFHWLAQMGNDPQEYVRQLRGNADTRWQAAVNLAGALHGEAGDEIKRDATVAAQMAQVLDDEIAAGGMEEGPIRMRIFLSRALGEFKVEAPLPTLIKAASTERSDEEIDVRRAAVQGIALLADNVKDVSLTKKYPALIPTLLQASKSDSDRLRAESAFALGVFDDPEASSRLEAMLHDPHPAARFNAAGALARRGDEVALPVLLEMLDADQSLALKDEKPEAHIEKRKLIHVNGLRALVRLKEAKPSLDLSDATAAVERLTKSELPEVRDNALAVKAKLSSPSAKGPAEAMP